MPVSTDAFLQQSARLVSTADRFVLRLRAQRENCLFFSCAAAAHEAGFRPCQRLRPEISPNLSVQVSTASMVARDLNLIAEGALDESNVEELAARVGVGGRHLRRLFSQHLGASPLAVAQTRRILFAKQLIDETSLSMTEVAMATGFMSIRRFNEAIGRTYQKSPRELRRLQTTEQTGAKVPDIKLKLPFSPPYNWAALVRFLMPRVTAGVEVVGMITKTR